MNLRGYDPDTPIPPGEALAGFLDALGVSGQAIPLEVDARTAKFRSEIADRRMLVVLDNASSVEQVRPLLPGAPACVVVVTSRDSLAGLVALHGARRLDLDLLSLSDAVELLTTLIGRRAHQEPASVDILAGQCARLPLALRVAAELAAFRGASPLSELVDELADRQRRLELLDGDGDARTAVQSVFSWSYQHLPADVARSFRLLGLHPGPDIDPFAAAALVAVSLDDSRRILDRLARAHLVHPAGSGRHGMHDLLRAYACGLNHDHPESERDTALTRLFDYYLSATTTAMRVLHPPGPVHERPPTCVAALDVQVANDRRGEGIAAEALTFLRESVRERGLTRLVIPVRPTTKDQLPSLPMEQFLGMRRPDGSSADPWVRVHERLDGQFVKVAPFSMTIVGTLAQWQSWTGSSLAEGANVVDGTLVPVLASTELNVGVYVEPNVWMEHAVGRPEAADGGS